MIVKSSYFKGNARTEIPTPKMAGTVCEVIVTHVFTEAVNTTDILELVPLIPFGKILAADIITENLGVLNLDMGLMSGTPGSDDAARTCGAELFNDQAAGAAAAAALLTIAGIAKNGETPVSIGVVPSVNIAAGATKKLHLRLRYIVG